MVAVVLVVKDGYGPLTPRGLDWSSVQRSFPDRASRGALLVLSRLISILVQPEFGWFRWVQVVSCSVVRQKATARSPRSSTPRGPEKNIEEFAASVKTAAALALRRLLL